MNDITDSKSGNPDDLEAEAHELIARGHSLLAEARRVRRPPADELLDGAGVQRVFGVKMRVLLDAKRRGEPIEISYAGRSPRVRRSDVERWAAWRGERLAKPLAAPAANDSVEAAYLKLAGVRR